MERAYTPAALIGLPRWERTKGPSSGRPESRRTVRSGLRRNLAGLGWLRNLHFPADTRKRVSAVIYRPPILRKSCGRAIILEKDGLCAQTLKY
jgi:hypothetical protein